VAGPGLAGRMAISRPAPEDVAHTIIDVFECLAVDLSIFWGGGRYRPATSVA
jgi:hypothetical protein